MSLIQSQPGRERIGILGGGQLGCMLADAAIALGLDPRILAEASSPAAALFPGRTQVGSVEAEADLRSFFSGADVIAFENEFLDCSLLERAAAGLSVRFAPPLPAIRELQDKLRQKELLTELGIPTADFLATRPGADADRAAQEAFERFDGQAVFKWSRMGYDGKGVHLAKPGPEGVRSAGQFCAVSLKRGVPVYAERKVAFRRELALVAVRSIRGGFDAFPLVVSEQENGICKRVLGPASVLGVPERLEAEARSHARRLAESLGLVGSFALELFETAEGTLLVNEIAPRVHNSGHYTQDACAASQFENHWRAILGMPLGPMGPRGPFGMLNLLGPSGLELTVAQRRDQLPFQAPPAGLRLHWYGKSGIRPLRKVGHVNGVVQDASELAMLEKRFQEYESAWIDSLRKLAAEARSSQRKENPS